MAGFRAFVLVVVLRICGMWPRFDLIKRFCHFPRREVSVSFPNYGASFSWKRFVFHLKNFRPQTLLTILLCVQKLEPHFSDLCTVLPNHKILTIVRCSKMMPLSKYCMCFPLYMYLQAKNMHCKLFCQNVQFVTVLKHCEI